MCKNNSKKERKKEKKEDNIYLKTFYKMKKAYPFESQKFQIFYFSI
jgi:deoxyadenosine/deoxycytidine kinase